MFHQLPNPEGPLARLESPKTPTTESPRRRQLPSVSDNNRHLSSLLLRTPGLLPGTLLSLQRLLWICMVCGGLCFGALITIGQHQTPSCDSFETTTSAARTTSHCLLVFTQVFYPEWTQASDLR
uniref:KASH domain-containing protein n=1 Tax=Steinernema glaseri TaxID=37863 RepID=A0A1I7YDE1_9BILA